MHVIDMQMLGTVGSRGMCMRMREIVAYRPTRRLYFLFLGPMLIATSPPVGPINAANGSNDAFCWHSHIPYFLWIRE